MSDLFMHRSAVIEGPFDCWRYELRRVWDHSLPLLVVVMLNPSTADAERDDPTILALIHFAKLWGYGGLLIVNFFAWRSSDPSQLFRTACGRDIGPRNDEFIHAAFGYAAANGGRVLAAWGAASAVDPLKIAARRRTVVRIANVYRVDFICLGETGGGQPKHPMARGKHRIPRDQQPLPWRASA